MNTLELINHQRIVEQTYSKRNINATVMEDILGDAELVQKIDNAVILVEDWMNQSYYQSKQDRLDELDRRDIRSIVEQIVVVTIQVIKPQLFTSVVGLVTCALGMTSKIDGTKTAAELLAIISDTDLFDIYKPDNKFDSLYLASNYQLDEVTQAFCQRTKYLPPMVVEPNVVSSNFDNAYLTEASAMILGEGTYHEDDICLDSINKFNQVALSLNEELLTSLSERPKRTFTDPEKKEQWVRFVKDSYDTYRDLIQVGNKMWLTHKIDKRGRTYAQGYHVSTQGNEFRKAIIEFHNKEIIGDY
jgi:hypothetical protein